MRVPTLKSLATQVVYNNIGLLNDVGTAPYSLVRTFLFRLTVNQLLEVERNSPHIMDDDDEIWYIIVAREFPLDPDHDDDSVLAEQSPEYGGSSTRAIPRPPPLESPNDDGDRVSSHSGSKGKRKKILANSWREYYHLCVQVRERRMAAAASRLRDKNRSIEQDRLKRQVEGLDIEAVRAKRRRMADSSKVRKPKSLMDKARNETRKIGKLYKSGGATASESAFSKKGIPSNGNGSRATPHTSMASTSFQSIKPLRLSPVRTLSQTAQPTRPNSSPAGLGSRVARNDGTKNSESGSLVDPVGSPSKDSSSLGFSPDLKSIRSRDIFLPKRARAFPSSQK